jgi:hypothetical protein
VVQGKTHGRQTAGQRVSLYESLASVSPYHAGLLRASGVDHEHTF